MPPFYKKLEVKMGSGGQTGRAYKTDPMSLFDPLALADQDTAEMPVPALTPVLVADAHVLAVPVFPTGEGYSSIGHGKDGGTLGRPVIDPFMWSILPQDGMEAPLAET